MTHLIDKDIVVAEIEKRIAENKKDIERASHSFSANNLEDYFEGYEDALALFKQQFLDTLEVKEVDLDKEIDRYYNIEAPKEFEDVLYEDIEKFAKHFFELGMRVNNPITAADRGTAEEIIINLKRIEKDYRIDLTREIEWLRNKVQKGE